MPKLNNAGPRKVQLYTAAVVAHPARAALAEAVATASGAESIAWDLTGVGCEVNHLNAWTWLRDAHTPWSLVLEDDVTLCDNFTDQLGQILAVPPPSPVVSLYLGRGHPHGGTTDWQNRISAKIATEVCWLTAESLLSAQGYLIRTSLINDMLNYVTPLSDPMAAPEGKRRRKAVPIDEAISSWCQSSGHLVSHTRPSIVDHKDLPPLIRRRADGQPRTAKRVAWLFGERGEWDNSTAHLTNLRTATVPE